MNNDKENSNYKETTSKARTSTRNQKRTTGTRSSSLSTREEEIFNNFVYSNFIDTPNDSGNLSNEEVLQSSVTKGNPGILGENGSRGGMIFIWIMMLWFYGCLCILEYIVMKGIDIYKLF